MNRDKNYTVYHCHSDLSNGVTNIDSITKFEEYVDYAASLGMKAFAFAEHGSVFQWVKKKVYIEKKGMKYIHAEEFYVTEELFQEPKTEEYQKRLTELTESLLGTDPEIAQQEIEAFIEDNKTKVRDNYHVVLIAKNYDGVCELNELSSKAFNKEDGHFYYAPRITMDELVNTSDNILVTTACIGGILCKGNKEIQTRMMEFLVANKHRCYLEIQHHIDRLQIEYNKYLVSISEKYNIPLIAGTDTHALNKTHLIGREILQKAKDVKFDNESKFDMTFKTYEELVNCYKAQNGISENKYLEAIENTNHMADRIEEFKLDYSYKYPKLYDDSLGVFKQKIIQGIKDRGVNKYSNFQEYKDKINYELGTYQHNGSIDFMLLEEDYKTALRKQGVYCGYSRGSVSGSIIAYLLGITDVDSIKYKLNFERFMNQERVSLADVDSDWYKGDRWRVRDYLYKKEGLYCCDIITFNTIAMKGAIKDVGRALGMSPDETQIISNAVEQDENKKDTIPDSYREKYPLLFQYVDIVSGTIVSVGNHPAGLVVSPHNVNKAFGTFYSSANENPISQINMKEVDMLNYVKLDVLGLDCVGLINQTCEFAGIPRLTPDNMNFNDMEVWKDIAEDCTMIFQFESEFAGSYLQDILKEETIKRIKEVNPNFSYIDLMSMANGAIRPAGASYRTELSQGIYRDNGHPTLNEFLAPTLGYLVYQEQIIEFLHKFCGFTMGEADVVRRGFAKKSGTDAYIPIIKDGGYLTEDKKHYIKGFIQTMKDNYNVEKEEAEELIVNFLQVIIDASDYLFSKNHADPYSYLGFACGYLRHHHLLEFLTAAMNIYKEDDAKSANIKAYAKRKGIEIKPIEFGKSKAEYFMDKKENVIYQGIEGLKFCNAQIAEELYELSKNKYDNFVELLIDINNKTSVNSRQLEILVGLNFFEQFGKNKYLLEIIKLCNGVKEGNKIVKPAMLTCKQLKKDKLDEYGISEYLAQKYCAKETAKQYSEIDNIGLVAELSKRIDNKALSVVEQVKFEQEYLNYVIYTNPKVHESYWIVTEYKTFKESRKPYCTLHNVRSGEDIKTKITSVKVYEKQPFGLYSVLKVNEFTTQFKKKNVNGEWVVSDETEEILTDYEVIK